mmetsp:Transcript_14708/g.45592  ORF Transcript_14708/g.45592 Transcript_14708/m.45592 type:complete len:247 (-) Transcript_14708:165-905(-)
MRSWTASSFVASSCSRAVSSADFASSPSERRSSSRSHCIRRPFVKCTSVCARRSCSSRHLRSRSRDSSSTCPALSALLRSVRSCCCCSASFSRRSALAAASFALASSSRTCLSLSRSRSSSWCTRFWNARSFASWSSSNARNSASRRYTSCSSAASGNIRRSCSFCRAAPSASSAVSLAAKALARSPIWRSRSARSRSRTSASSSRFKSAPCFASASHRTTSRASSSCDRESTAAFASASAATLAR